MGQFSNWELVLYHKLICKALGASIILLDSLCISFYVIWMFLHAMFENTQSAKEWLKICHVLLCAYVSVSLSVNHKLATANLDFTDLTFPMKIS